jgi:anti-sigma factor RsiW
MTCDDFQLRLTAYSLGELEQDELQAARDHVAGCDDCASRALLDRQLTALLRGSAVPAPAETRAAVLTAVRAEARRDEPAARPAGRAAAGTGSPWPRPCWPPPPWSPRPCW